MVFWIASRGLPYFGEVAAAPQGFQPALRRRPMPAVEFDAEVLPPGFLRRDQGRAGTGEGIEHHAACGAERLDQRLQAADRLLGRVQLVAGVLPFQNVRDRPFRQGGIAFRQQIGLLVRRLHEARARCVFLAKDDMADGPETRAPPRRHELVGLVPAIEADTEAVGFEQPLDMPERRINPVAGAVVFDALAVAAAVIAEVRWIGQAEIDRFRSQAAHDVGAVAVQDGVGRYHWAPPSLRMVSKARPTCSPAETIS